MRLRIASQLVAIAALCAAVPALAGVPPVSKAAAAAPAVASAQACDVTLNVHDPDPKGLNVRATPSGRVVTALKPDGEWTEVHAVASSGDWLRIDAASTVDDDAPDGMRDVFRGDGWVHVSGLGISELMTGEGTMLRASPSDSAKLLKRIGPDDEPKRTRILGCSGKFIKVDADGLVAWTRQYCTNERTTCS